jgi:hypothetical protein
LTNSRGFRGEYPDQNDGESGPYGVWTTISSRAPPRRSTGLDRPRPRIAETYRTLLAVRVVGII